MASLASRCTLVLLLCYVHRVQGFVSHSPNCTLPEPGTNYVAAGNVRSTHDILWSSLATIIACTYSVLHLNVPLQRDGRDPGWKGDLAWGWRGLQKKVKWCIVTILAPEWYLMIAFTEYNSARHLQRKLVALSEDIHGRRQWSLRECFYINMGGYAISQRNDSNGRATVHLWQESFIHLLQQDPSSVLPQLLSDDEIADRSKSDVFTKTVILIQVCYFCITLFTRWSKQLPVTPLEVATIAYAACSVFSYGLFLYKPQGATVVAMVAHCNTMLPDPLLLVLDTELSGHRISLLDPIENGNVSIAWTPQAHRLYSMILSLISALFGAVHLAAWTSTFPTTIERSIWRVATVISMVVFAMAFASTWLRSGNEMSDTAKLGTRTIMNSIDDIIAIELMVTYPLARLVLIVEMFRSLAYLPPEAFIATWTSNVPHFG